MILGFITLGINAVPQGGPPIEDPPIEISSLPTISVRQDRSLYEIPEITITFSNGHQDELILEKHFPNDEARLENEEHCNYFGHLKNDPNACVAVTGCYGLDDMEFTIMSEHSADQNMFVLEKDGKLRAVEIDKKLLKGHIENEIEVESRDMLIYYNGNDFFLFLFSLVEHVLTQCFIFFCSKRMEKEM